MQVDTRDGAVILANWVPWNTMACTQQELMWDDSRFGAIILAESSQDLSARNTPTNLLHVPRHSASSAAMVTVKQRRHTKKDHVRNKNHPIHKVVALKSIYQNNPRPSEYQKNTMAVKLDMTIDQVSTWFCNYRKRNRLRGVCV